jgi:acetyltransferase
MRQIAGAIADAARTSGRTIVAYHPTALGPVDGEIVKTLHAARVPLLMGIAGAMGALKHLLHPQQDAVACSNSEAAMLEQAAAPFPADFLAARTALAEHGVAVVECARAGSLDEAVALLRRFAQPVALKAEAPGLLHKSDLGCVQLGCKSTDDVAEAYHAIVSNARKAGFEKVDVLVQPMVSGVAEAYAGVINDPHYGPAIVFGLGGIFVETLRDTTTRMAPLSKAEALHMIASLKAAPVLMGARGRERADVEALAALLVALGRFAVANYGRFRALDLNPIIVKSAGAIAVDIAVEGNA